VHDPGGVPIPDSVPDDDVPDEPVSQLIDGEIWPAPVLAAERELVVPVPPPHPATPTTTNALARSKQPARERKTAKTPTSRCATHDTNCQPISAAWYAL